MRGFSLTDPLIFSLKIKAAARPARVLPLPVGAVMVKSFWDRGASLMVRQTVL